MATSAFRSTTKRNPISSSTAHSSSSSRNDSAIRRSRSLSRFSRRLTMGNDDDDDPPRAPTGRFVNTVRGSGFFPEISLDDLAIDFFGSSGDRGRSDSRRESDVSPRITTGSSQRGRSVSRKSASCSYKSGGGSTNSEMARRRRSVSVVRCQISDSESDADNFRKSTGRASSVMSNRASSQAPVSRKPKVMKDGPALRRSTRQMDLKPYDDYSSHSSALTDEEAKYTNSSKGTAERTIRAVYAQKAEHPMGEDVNAGLYQAMRKELRNAVEEMRMDLEKVFLKSNPSRTNGGRLPMDNTDMRRAVSSIRRNYTSKSQQSERCNQDLLTEILLEEEHGKDTSEIMKDSLTKSKANGQEKPRSRKRSNDRCRMSKCLSEEAEKYIQDFISNVEDTDMSSLDGERSDTSLTMGGVLKLENARAIADRPPLGEMDGVALPWLQWETSDDVSSQSQEQIVLSPLTRKSCTVKDSNESRDQSHISSSSLGSCSPGTVNGPSAAGRYARILSGDVGKSNTILPSCGFDMDECMKRQSEEDYLIERWRQGKSIESGGMILCEQTFF